MRQLLKVQRQGVGMHLFWSQKVQWRGTGEESVWKEEGRRGSLVDPQLIELHHGYQSFENGDALILLNLCSWYGNPSSIQSLTKVHGSVCVVVILVCVSLDFVWGKDLKNLCLTWKSVWFRAKIAYEKQEVMSQKAGNESGTSWGGPQKWGFEAVLSQSQGVAWHLVNSKRG